MIVSAIATMSASRLSPRLIADQKLARKDAFLTTAGRSVDGERLMVKEIT